MANIDRFRFLKYAVGMMALLLPLVGSTDNPRAGQLELEPTIVEYKGEELSAEKGTLYVAEDWDNPDSKLIQLPVIRVPATNQESAEPIFLFGGGPGIPNMNVEHLPHWLLDNHDAVMVGYRGVDGPSAISSSEIDEILKTDFLLSLAGLKSMGEALTLVVQQLQESGMDIKEYNIINVVDDMEAARLALGYEKINIAGGSYGGAVCYAYCLRYPDSIHRNIMTEAAFPWNLGYADPGNVDHKLQRLNDLWQSNPECLKLSADIVETIREVLKTLQREWNRRRIDPGKIRVITYLSLYKKDDVARVFQAFVDAKNGDYSGLAVMSLMWDYLIADSFNSGDLLAKTFSTQTNPDRDYATEMYPTGSIIGSPLSQLAWGVFQYTEWPVELFVDTYPKPQRTDVETLVVYGSSEAGEPAKKEFESYFTKAQWVILKDLGHMDIWTAQPEALFHLQKRFFDDGVSDTSKFELQKEEEWDFKPTVTFQQMAQQMMPQDTK